MGTSLTKKEREYLDALAVTLAKLSHDQRMEFFGMVKAVILFHEDKKKAEA